MGAGAYCKGFTREANPDIARLLPSQGHKNPTEKSVIG